MWCLWECRIWVGEREVASERAERGEGLCSDGEGLYCGRKEWWVVERGGGVIERWWRGRKAVQ